MLAVGIIGAVAARFKPDGMARALSATAFAQALVGIIALVAGLGSTAPSFPEAVVFATGFFATLWLLSACLFRKAAREQTVAGAAPQAGTYAWLAEGPHCSVRISHTQAAGR